MKGERLDEYLLRNGAVKNKEEAFVIVTEGRVFVNGQKAVSPAQLVKDDDRIEVRRGREFVGRGAYKLTAALDHFGIDVRGKACADIGAATGGFTEVLLKRGAKKIYAIDAGRGKLDLKLREDPGVVVMEGVNVLDIGTASAFFDALAPSSDGATLSARRATRLRRGHADSPRDGLERRTAAPTFESLEKVDLATIDLSFTSLRRVLPIVRPWLSERGIVVSLFKPQYEVKDKSFLKHGILRDERVRTELVEAFRIWLSTNGWHELGMTESPIRGSEGNTEYLFWLKPE